ncbi:hypothetical protein [Asticcacaulis taihuensis]|uniref:hypothetical protein n=1 Tax=Asticcacaulis taihuensis TaxID=260084 RepID=UPI0026F27839|nr:hypothetical protein [Asticcacaulis taihuensis]
MATKIQIINMALGHLGQGPTEALTIDTMRDAARKVLIFADMARDMTLGDHDWLEARVPVTLQPLSLSALTGWAQAYGLPAGFLRVSQVEGCGRWEVGLYNGEGAEQKVLYSDAALSAASVIITCDWATLSPQLALAVSLKMAWLAAISVLGNSSATLSTRSVLAADYLEACRDAARIEAFGFNDPDDRVPGFQDYRRLAI